MVDAPYFRAEVKKQWEKLKTNIPALYAFINTTASRIRSSAGANFERWDVYNSTLNYVTILQKWENEVQFIKDYLDRRTRWLEETVRDR